MMALAVASDHPRIRGEHESEPTQRRSRFWIIPAYAGSTNSLVASHTNGTGSSPHTRGALDPGSAWVLAAVDHPRIRGEHP